MGVKLVISIKIRRYSKREEKFDVHKNARKGTAAVLNVWTKQPKFLSAHNLNDLYSSILI